MKMQLMNETLRYGFLNSETTPFKFQIKISKLQIKMSKFQIKIC